MNLDIEHAEREDLLEQIFSVVLEAVVVIDCSTRRIMDLNAKAAEIIGCPKEAILGRTCHQLICAAPRGECPICDLGQTLERAEGVVRGSHRGGAGRHHCRFHEGKIVT